MRELNVSEMEEVNGGVIPAIIGALVIKAAIKAAKSKKVQAAVAGAIGTIAGWISE